MTTIMAAEFDGGVVVAADSGTTFGLTKISDRIYCCLSGSPTDTQAITDIISHLQESYRNTNEPPLVLEAADLFKASCSDNRVQLPDGIIVAGWDREEGGQVYSVPLEHIFGREHCAISGSGRTCTSGYLAAEYKEGMNKGECLNVVFKAASKVMLYDKSSGGIFHLAVITEDGVEMKTHKSLRF